MTVIVGVTDGENVTMGCDSFCGNYYYDQKQAGSKIVKLTASVRNEDGTKGNDLEILAGLSGDLRHLFLVRTMDVPEWNKAEESLFDYFGGTFVEALREKYESVHYNMNINGRDGGNSHILLGCEGRLFTIQDNFQLFEPQDNYTAIGAGQEIALGALGASKNNEPCETSVLTALDICAKHSPWVSAPFDVFYLEGTK